jgi:nucleoside-diphosphate-sugar epimerase
MGGAGFVFTGENDADIMHNSAVINLNILDTCHKRNIKRIFYSSSACVYPEYNQMDPDNPKCSEDSTYPAAPDSEYGWEKLFSERIYLSYHKNHAMEVRIARYHNIFGPEGTWTEGSLRLMGSNWTGPVNIGSEEMVTINQLAEIIMEIAGKKLSIKHIPGPLGVRGRNSDNRLIYKKLKWKPKMPLRKGLEITYKWIEDQIQKGGFIKKTSADYEIMLRFLYKYDVSTTYIPKVLVKMRTGGTSNPGCTLLEQ